jgi:hypothetical protein
MEYYSAKKKNKIMLFACKWMELKIIMLSKLYLAQKGTGHISPYMWKLDYKLFIQTYTYIHAHTYTHGERKKENMIGLVDLSDGTTGGRREKENDRECE